MKLKSYFPIVIFLVFALAAKISMSQELLTVSKLQTDFGLFRQALEKAHPGLYRYTSKENFDYFFESTLQKIDHEMTQQEFYKLLLPVVGQIKCGHTKLHPDNNWTSNFYFNVEKVFPWRLHFDGEKAYVLGDYINSDNVPKGAEIVSIHGKPISEIIHTMLPAFFSDGNNITFKYIELDHYFSAYYANLFDVPDSFSVVYKTNTGLKKQNITSISHTITEEYEKQQEELQEKILPYSFEMISNETVLLTIRSFWEEADDLSYEKFLKNSFETIREKQVNNLVIDLRNNEGGIDRRGALLMSYLTDKEFRYYDRLEMTTNKKFSFAKYAHLPKFYEILRHLISKEKDGTYRWNHSKNLKIQKPQKNNFDGKVYVLINGASFSVTAEFAAVAHYLKRATFIGEEAGGGYYGNNSGAFTIVTLPNSKLNIGIPLMAYYLKVDGYPFPDRGVIPDYEVKPTIEDLLTGNDKIMDYTLKRILK
jgi:hypothetical protein